MSARTLLREGANHPLTRAAAVALLRAAAGHLGPAGPGGRRTSECRCRVSPR
ncbi:hypothetical protein [Streptomyces tricolor]|uniref:hypothetical protein n=1 Tax=Streptomyces tricolor TaxID=68277 RepID=UPI0036E25480